MTNSSLLDGLGSRWPDKTRILGRVFDDTAASYKFFWFLGLLELLQNRDSGVLRQEEIIREMIAAAWAPVCFYRLSLGLQDKLQEVVKDLQKVSKLPNDAKPSQVLKGLKEFRDLLPKINSLGDLVPTRFLSPWFSKELSRVIDHKKTTAIWNLSLESQKSPSPCPYTFVGRGSDVEIHVSPSWRLFLIENFTVLRAFAQYHLCKYLQRRNPNVPGVVNKLSIPITRNLAAATKYWNTVRVEFARTGKLGLFGDIYSGELLEDKFTIDHFLPWSFVAHDLLWNLVPVTKTTNSQKGDNLPAFDPYLRKLALFHREALRVSPNSRTVEDYCTGFRQSVDDLRQADEQTFIQQFREVYQPQFQIAINQGFSQDWTWHE